MDQLKNFGINTDNHSKNYKRKNLRPEQGAELFKQGGTPSLMPEITYKEIKGKRLIGHTKNYDVYEDTEGNTYNYWGTK